MTDLFDKLEHETLYVQREGGLEVAIAVHSTARGPAIGGTRWRPYADFGAAVSDALRLSRAMSLKCALAGLPSGGGKAVINSSQKGKSTSLLAAYAQVLNRMGDLFGTGEDVGFSLNDCERLAAFTPYVAGTRSRGAGDPSHHTAAGAFYAVSRAVSWRWPGSDLQGCRVLVQGLGAVGAALAQRLVAAGAVVHVADIEPARVAGAVEHLAATAIHPAAAIEAEVDVLVPCALGDVVLDHNVDRVFAKLIVGPANNQLGSDSVAMRLAEREITWVPDFLVGAGGVAGAAEEVAAMPGRPPAPTQPLAARLAAIGDRTCEVLQRAAARGITPEAAAIELARALLVEPRLAGG